MMRKLFFLSTFIFLLNACQSVTVPNTTACTIAGDMAAGMICAETLTSKTYDLTFDQTIEFLEPDPPQVGHTQRAGAICESSLDWNKKKTALEQACRILGDNCNYELKLAIAGMQNVRRLLRDRERLLNYR